MSVKVMGIVWDHFPLGGGERLTALCLADHADHEGGSIFPSIARIADKTMQSERTIQRHLAGMREIGWLVEVTKADGTPGKTTTYRMPIERIPLGTVGRVTKLHPSSDGCHPEHRRVTNEAGTGDIAMSPKQLLTVIEPSLGDGTFSLPDWIEPAVWQAYVEMRKKIKKPMTARARDLVVKALHGMKQQGQNITAVLEQSIRNSWTDVYVVRKEKAAGGADWMFDEQKTLAKAAELKIATNGLTWPQLRAKISARIENQKG